MREWAEITAQTDDGIRIGRPWDVDPAPIPPSFGLSGAEHVLAAVFGLTGGLDEVCYRWINDDVTEVHVLETLRRSIGLYTGNIPIADVNGPFGGYTIPNTDGFVGHQVEGDTVGLPTGEDPGGRRARSPNVKRCRPDRQPEGRAIITGRIEDDLIRRVSIGVGECPVLIV